MAAGSNLVLSVLLRAVDRISGPVRRVQGRLGTFRRQAEAIGRRVGFERLTSSLAGAGKAARDLYATTARLTRRLVLAGTLGAAAMFGLTNATANLGGQTVNVADMLGIHVEQLQALRYAAEQAGLSAGNFDLALRRMIRRTSEAAQGGGPAKDALEELGLAAEALSRKSPEEALGIVADALARVRNQGDRLRIAFALFDTDGAAMVNMLRDGSAGLEQMAARARQLGHVMDTTAARRAERFSGQLLDLQKTLLGVRTTVAVALMPVVGQWMAQLTTLIQHHGPQIRAFAQQFAAELPARLVQLKDGFVALAESLRPAIALGQALVERFGAVQTAVVGLGVVIGAPLIVPLLKMALALGSVGVALGRVGVGVALLAAKALPLLLGGLKALGVAALANPVVAIIAAVAAGAVLLIANWERVGPFFSALWDRLRTGAAAAWARIWALLQQEPLDLLIGGWQRAVAWLADIDWRAAAASGWELLKTLFKWSPVGLLVRGFGAAREWLSSVDWAAAAAVGWDILKTLFRWSPLGLLQQGFTAALGWLAQVDWQAAAASGWEVLKTLFKWSPLGLLVAGFGRAQAWLAAQDWAAHGQVLLETLAAGIKAAAGKPVEMVRAALERVRALLPFSDAKEGPLAALTASGAALPATLAAGIKQGAGAFLAGVQALAGQAAELLSGAWGRLKGWLTGGHDTEATLRTRTDALPELPALEGEARYRVLLGELPTLPLLRAEAWYQPLLGALPELPTLTGRALFTVEVLGLGAALEALRTVASVVVPARGEDDAGDMVRVAEPVLGQPIGSVREPLGRAHGGITVQRVDFRPQITIQTSDASTADRLAEAVEQLLERWSQRELWTQVQGVQEVG